MKNLDNVTNVWGKVDERRHEVLEVSVQGMRNRWPLGFPLVKFRNAAGEEYAHSFKDDMQSNKVRVELNDRDVKRAGVCVMTVEWHEKGRVVASREYMGLIEGKKMEKPKYEVIGGKEDCAGGNGGGGLPEGGEPYKQLVTDGNGETVWEDRLAYKTVNETVLVDNVTIEMSDVSGLYIQNVEASGEFVADNVYKVLYDNEKYECTAYVGGEGVVGIGNAGIAGATGGNGEPFFIGGAGNGVLQVITTTGGSHTIKISQTTETIKPISPEYIGGWKALGESVPVETEIVASQTLTYADGGDGSGMGVVQNPFALDLKDGITYKVTWDGTEYESVAYAIEQVICIGNGDFLGLTGYGNNEPYFFYSGAGTVVGACREAGEHTVKIVGMLSDIIPCPREYLPENLCEVVIVDLTKPITTDEALTLLNEAKSGKALFYMTSNKLYYPLHAIEGYPTTHIHLYDTPYHYLAYKPVNGVYDWSESTNVYTGFNASSFTVCDYNEPSAYISVNTGSSGIGGGKSVNVRQSGGVFDTIFIDNTIYFVLKNLVLRSSTEGSTKKFFIKVDDSGTLSATEVT